MPNDMVALAMERASARFGGSDGIFSSAGFGVALKQLSGLEGAIDGHLVRTILTGRRDVIVLSGGHYRLRRPGRLSTTPSASQPVSDIPGASPTPPRQPPEPK